MAAAMFGVGIGGLLTLLPIAWADYYGRLSYGAIRGIALSVQVLAQASGPLLSGILRDWSGSYDLSLQCFVVLSCLSVLAALLAREPHPRGPHKEDCELAIKYEKRDGVAYITLNNPAKANIFDKPTSDEISAAWIDLWEDRDIRCAILTGAGDRHFCGGHNLAPRENITEEEREYLRTQRIFWPLAGTVHGQKTGVDGRMGDHYPRVWKPVIARGERLGCGRRPLRPAVVDRHPHRERRTRAVQVLAAFAGLAGSWTGREPARQQLRYADAMKILLTDEPFDAQEALRIGLVNEVVPHAQLMERAEKIARHIVTLPPVAVRMMKEFVVRFGDLPTDQAWHVQNLINNLLIQVTTDGEEGRQAFNEKRPPNFSGALRRRGEAWEEPSEEDAARLDEAYRSGEF